MKFCDEKIQKHLLMGGKIKRKSDNFPVFLNEYGNMCYQDMYYTINKNDLTADDWEIVEPEYDWDKIIKDKILCVFNYINEPNDLYGLYPILGYLKEYKPDEDYKFTGVMIDSCKADFKQCKPFNPADYNIVKDLNGYEK